MSSLDTIKLLGSVLAAFCAAMPLQAADVKGRVSLDYEGLFQVGSAMQPQTVSVALVPAEGQRTVRRSAHKYHVKIADNRMHPAFLTIAAGDHIQFTNRDAVFHELFSLSPGEPMQARLNKVVGEKHPTVRFTLKNIGTTHFFCRIHSKSYARIDVVNTPYLQMLKPGGVFHFTGLPAGKWRLRIAASAAETQWLDVAAMTRPTLLDLELSVLVKDADDDSSVTHEQVKRLYEQPGEFSQ